MKIYFIFHSTLLAFSNNTNAYILPHNSQSQRSHFILSSSNNHDHIIYEAPKITNITFCSGNEMKKSEVQAILTGNIPYSLIFDSVDFDEPQASPIEISQNKCRQALKHVKGPCLVEDTSLCYNALNGLPGPYIKWFAESLGKSGIHIQYYL